MFKYQRLIKRPDETFLLLGARGTGKSTWLAAEFPNSYLIDLLDEGRYQRYLAQPGLFAEEIQTQPQDRWVIVDEIQRLPQLLNEVHRLHEREKRKFALCGSSARKLRRAGVNLLAGRALRHELFPFLSYELKDDFDLNKALRFGTIPIVWQAKNCQAVLESYVQLYIREEIQAEALVKNLPAFARFLPISALFHAQSMNLSSLARDSEAHRSTIAGYVEVLEDTLLAYRLEAFQSNLRVREKRHPKFYFIDSGLVRALRRDLGPIGLDEKGSLFEGWIANTLRAYNSYNRVFDDWFYWSPAEAKVEVDFLLRQGREYIAIEAKASDRVGTEHLKGLRAISELKGLRKRILVYPGKVRRRTDDNIDILPVADFLELLSASFR